MEYVNFGRAGVKVSRLALGLGFRGQPDERAMERVIERAIEHGINFIDCANVYGPMDDRAYAGRSEAVLGKVLKRHRDDLFISTKVSSAVGPGPNDQGGSRYHIMREVERSLRRLDTDHVDVYILHHFDPSTPLEETLRAMDDLVTQGKTRYVGVSNYRAWQVVKALWVQDQLGLDPLVCAQNPYNLLNRELEEDLFPAAREHGVGIMAYSPLAVGLVSGAYRPGEAPAEGTLYATDRFRGRLEEHMGERGSRVLEALRQVAGRQNRSVAQVALNWVLSHPEITVGILGADTPEQVDENVGAVGWTITEDDRALLDEASS
ncbi:MAG: aldo/keto reductase [Chloroflexota bacterium]